MAVREGPRFVDTLVHLDDARIEDVDAWLREASRHGVCDVLWAGTDPQRDPRCAPTHNPNIATHDVRIFHAAGLHPRRVRPDALQTQLDALHGALERGPAEGFEAKRWCAVGEIGLDGRDDSPPADAQEQTFNAQLNAARAHRLPVVLHCVQRVGRLAELLEAAGGAPHGGVLHGFSGPAEMVPRFIDLGLSFSFGGLLLNERATRCHEAARVVPAECLLLETDAPDLPASAWPRLVEVLADLRWTSPEIITEQTTTNARRVFGMPTLDM